MSAPRWRQANRKADLPEPVDDEVCVGVEHLPSVYSVFLNSVNLMIEWSAGLRQLAPFKTDSENTRAADGDSGSRNGSKRPSGPEFVQN